MSNEGLRRRIYDGELECLPSRSQSLLLVQTVEDMLVDVMGKDYRRVQFQMDESKFFEQTLALKKSVYDAEPVRRAAFALIESCGFGLAQNVLDPPRVRFIEHEGHLNAAAQVAYRPHRDTWYANPQAQINWWIPLHDVSEDETFCFYKARFDQPVANTSADFSYDDWMQKVGFGKSHQSKSELYPLPKESETELGPLSRFSLKRGEILLFSAAHLHQTLPNISGRTRVSIDFRTVCLDDATSDIGAPNVDNESTGSALSSYLSMPGRYER